MGSFIEINDTLRITKEQGFPEELDLETHSSLQANQKFVCIKYHLFETF
jgi:hypothetical protein